MFAFTLLADLFKYQVRASESSDTLTLTAASFWQTNCNFSDSWTLWHAWLRFNKFLHLRWVVRPEITHFVYQCIEGNFQHLLPLNPALFVIVPRLTTWSNVRMLMNSATVKKGDQCFKLSLINNMVLIIGIFNCMVTYAIVKGKPPDTWKLFFNYQ